MEIMMWRQTLSRLKHIQRSSGKTFADVCKQGRYYKANGFFRRDRLWKAKHRKQKPERADCGTDRKVLSLSDE